MHRTSASRGFWAYAASAFLQAASKNNIRSLSLNAPSSMAAAAGSALRRRVPLSGGGIRFGGLGF